MTTFAERFAKRLGVTENKGLWDAQANQPALVSGVGQKNNYYIVSVAGNTMLDGESDWGVGDWVFFDGTKWIKIDNSERIEVVNSLSGNENDKAPSVSSVKTYISAISSSIDANASSEESARASADTSLTSRISTEESNRASADTSLTSRISTEESARSSAISAAIKDLVGTSPTILSTLGQIATALSDEDAATGILNALEAENSQRVFADTSLTSRISSEESNRASADTSLTSRISSEESNRASADTSLTSRISTEESNRASADSSLNSLISSRTSVDLSLESRISSEESVRTSADTSLTSRISTEESNRASADTSLTSRISTEESARSSAISAAIKDLVGTSPTILSTLGQIATALSDGDAATGILNALEAENSQRVSADSSLTSRISSEESVRASADSSLSSYVSTELSTLQASSNSVKKVPIKSVSSNYTITTQDYLVVGASNLAITITLPSISSSPAGTAYFVKNRSSSNANLTVAAASGNTIDDDATVVIEKNQSIQVVSDGSVWIIC
jgi:hypothetical protein